MDMKKWKEAVLAAPRKKAMPILSFPCAQLMGISVRRLISDSARQAEGIGMIARRVDSLAALGMMDLSVEAEAFGSEIRASDTDVPTVAGRIIETLDDAGRLKVPPATAARGALYIEAIRKAACEIRDRPVFAGVIGPFSLAGRLMDMTEIMINCYEEPGLVHAALEKTSDFIADYILAFKKAGANGVIMAEPAAGLLSPALAEEFSSRYAQGIVRRVKDDGFFFLYHNCGPNTSLMLPSLLGIGADAYHFGDAVKMAELLEGMPAGTLVMGNVSPSAQFLKGSPESVYGVTMNLLRECAKYGNFIVSSGCDIPPMSPWENIDSFFRAVKDFYK